MMFRILLFVNLVGCCLGAVGTASCGGGLAYVGVSFSVTCAIDGAIVDGGIVWYRPDGSNVVTCDASGSCSTDLSGYSVTSSTSTAQTLVISSPIVADDTGDFACQDGLESFIPCTLEVVPAMSTTLVQNDLQSLTSQTYTTNPALSLTVVASCTKPVGVCTWSYQNTDVPSDSGTFDSTYATTTSPTTAGGQSCSGSLIYTMCSLSLNTIPAFLADRKVTLSLSITHASLSSPIVTSSSSVLTFSSTSTGGGGDSSANQWNPSVFLLVIGCSVNVVLLLCLL